MEHVKMVGGWYLEDGAVRITSKRVMKMIEVTSDPRSDFYNLVRKENLPTSSWGGGWRRACWPVLAQLRATANWHRIMREWVCMHPPRRYSARLNGASSSAAATPDARAADGSSGTCLPPRGQLPFGDLEEARSFEQIPFTPSRAAL